MKQTEEQKAKRMIYLLNNKEKIADYQRMYRRRPKIIAYLMKRYIVTKTKEELIIIVEKIRLKLKLINQEIKKR